MLWSDGTKIEHFGNNSPCHVWRKKSYVYDLKKTIGTVKHGGGSIRICCLFSVNGTKTLHVIEGNMNAEMYQDTSLTEKLNLGKR